MSKMEFVLRFRLSHPGTSNPVHLASNIAVVERGRYPRLVATHRRRCAPA